MKWGVLIVSIAVACLALPAMAGSSSPAAQSMGDLDRNAALGAVLVMRPGTRAELDELRLLADRGEKLARQAVASSPDSADAQYALGSWLLYGYKPVESDQISFDAQGNARTEQATRVVQGLKDDPTEGLAALKQASDLAPTNTGYLLDYAAALMDYDRADDAEGILEQIWAGKAGLAVQHRIRAGMLLSAIAENSGDLDGAREWIYSALSLDPLVAPAIERLRDLDYSITEAAIAAQWEPEEPEVLEPTPSMPDEGVGEEQRPEQGADQLYEEAPPESNPAPYEEAPAPETAPAPSVAEPGRTY